MAGRENWHASAKVYLGIAPTTDRWPATRTLCVFAFLPCSVSGVDPFGSAGQKTHQFLSEAQTDPVGTDSHLGKISGFVDTRCQRDCLKPLGYRFRTTSRFQVHEFSFCCLPRQRSFGADALFRALQKCREELFHTAQGDVRPQALPPPHFSAA